MGTVFQVKLSLCLRSAVKLSRSQFNCPLFKSYHITRKEYRKHNFKKSIPGDNFIKFRYYSSTSEMSDDEVEVKSKEQQSIKVKAGLGKYKFFADFDSPVILDVDEERQLRLERPELFEVEEKKDDEFAGINLERGVNGVYDIEELVDILKKENAKNIVVIAIPPEYQYVDHMVVVSGRSLKHLLAMAEFIKKLYKRKKAESDYFPVIEGRGSKDWMAIDLGNIALHFQTEESRQKYDIEMLWAVGPQYDDQVNEKEDQYITLLNQHTVLADLEPLDFQEPSKPGADSTV